MAPTTITLAGRSYEIKPLTLGQIEDMSVASVLPDSNDPQENIRRSYRRTIDVIAAGLATGYPNLTADELRKMTITKDELRAAYATLLEFSGLVVKEATKGTGEGEAEPPGKPGASTGATSTDGSAQA